MSKSLLYDRVLAEARAAGLAALQACVPTPMVVQGHSNCLDDSSPVVYQEVVSGGVCGFASVIISPGTSGFARYITKLGIAGKDYYGGTRIGIREGGQSLERKEAYANAFSDVLCQYQEDLGIKYCRVDSRLD